MTEQDNRFMVSCRKAVELDQKGQWVPLQLKERIQLRLHQGICVACKRFLEQSMLIEQAMGQLGRPLSDVQIDEEFKQELIRKLNRSNG